MGAHPISDPLLHERQGHVVHNFEHRTVVVKVQLLPSVSKSSLHEKMSSKRSIFGLDICTRNKDGFGVVFIIITIVMFDRPLIKRYEFVSISF